MKIIVCDYVYTPEGFKKDLAVAFESVIIDIDSFETIQQKYPNATIIETAPHSILYPGFINTHVHLEFSTNKTTLQYGDFMPWLDSVIANRDELIGACDNIMMRDACDDMLRSGITSFGAISSFGNELQVCEQTPQRVVFFNELIGSNMAYVDMLFGDFQERLKASKQCSKSSRITPAIAIHSPYSVHPIVLQKAVNIAQSESLLVSAHLLESKSEREWLENGEGEFKTFFEKYFNTSTPVTNIDEFIHAFDSHPTHFTHCVQATQKELDYLSLKGHSIAHCPRSNRYLGCGRLPIENLSMPFSIATDGLSSNDSLNIFDELRAGLMLHHQAPMRELANRFIKAVTSDSADILRLNCGRIDVGKNADFAVVTMREQPKQEEDLALWTILHTKEATQVYIEGEKYV
ncbi:MAG: metal-dependent hydrolase [Sulfurovum sp.]